MELARYSSPIDASEERVWQVLVDKIEHPTEYVAPAEDSEIRSRDGNTCVRWMKTPDAEVVERITTDRDAGRITYATIEHPVLDGSIVNEIERQNGRTVLTFRAEGDPKGDPQQITARFGERMRTAVLATKEIAEEHEEG